MYKNTLPTITSDMGPDNSKKVIANFGPHQNDGEEAKERAILAREARSTSVVQHVPIVTSGSYTFLAFSIVLAVVIGFGFVEGINLVGKVGYNYIAQKIGISQNYLNSNSNNYSNDGSNGGNSSDPSSNSIDFSGGPVQRSLGSDDVSEGIPVITDSLHYEAISPSKSIRLSTPSFLVGDVSSGEVLVSRKSTSTYPLASVTKLMTAIVTKENIDLHHEAVVTREAYNTFGNEGELMLGEKILVSDLLVPLLIESSNKGAEVLAYDYGREDFLKLMNGKAKQLRMNSTYYNDASGLDARNVSSPNDLFRLAQFTKRTYPEIFDTTRIREYTIYSHAWKNQNAFLLRSDFKGGKNGFIDEAKKTTVSLFDITLPVYHIVTTEIASSTASSSAVTTSEKIKTNKTITKTFAVIILYSNDRNTDAAALINYVKQNFLYVDNPEEKDTI